MACKKPEINEKLLAYMENLLKAEEKKEVESHIPECSVCKEELSALSEVSRILAGCLSKEKVKESSCPSNDILLKYAQQEGIPESVNTRISEHLKVCPLCPGIVSLLKEHIRYYPVKEEYNKDLQLPDSLRAVIKEKYPVREIKEEKEISAKPAILKTKPGLFAGLFKPALAFAAVLLILTGTFIFIKNSYERGAHYTTPTPSVAATFSPPPSIATRDGYGIKPELKSKDEKPSEKAVTPAISPKAKNEKEETAKTELNKTKTITKKIQPEKPAASGAGKASEGKSEMGISSSPNEEIAVPATPGSLPAEKPRIAAKMQENVPPAAAVMPEKTRTTGVSNATAAPAPSGYTAQSKDIEENSLQKKAQEAADKTLGKNRAAVRVSVTEEAPPGKGKTVRKINVVVTLEKSATIEETNKVKEAIKNSFTPGAEEKENINFVFILK